MKSPGIYEEKTKSSGIEATIKAGKHTVPNNKINMPIHNCWAKKKKKEKKKKWITYIYDAYAAWTQFFFQWTRSSTYAH